MSYNITLTCGCVVYVSCSPRTRVAHTRIIQTRGPDCRVRKHDVGVRLFLWELLPARDERPVEWFDASDLAQPTRGTRAS